MTVSLKPVARDDLDGLFRLTVTDAQSRFVASNPVSIAQAAYEPNTEIFGIWADQTLVGLISLITTRGYPHLEEGDDPNAGFVWRLLIGQDHQGKGYGRAAMEKAHDWARAKELPKMYISAVPENGLAIGLYESIGYQRTGRIVDGEVELVKLL